MLAQCVQLSSATSTLRRTKLISMAANAETTQHAIIETQIHYRIILFLEAGSFSLEKPIMSFDFTNTSNLHSG